MNEAELVYEESRIFYRDVESYKGTLSHISDEINDVNLKKLDEWYGVTSKLSAQNRDKHRKIILYLAITGTLLTLCFLLYDGFDMHDLIIGCIIALVGLYLILDWSNRLDCHRKYLEYRLLAESFRVQFFLSSAALEIPVTDLLPWFVKKGVPWIEEVIEKEVTVTQQIPKNDTILDFWIDDQIEYHSGAIEREEAKLKRNKLIYNMAFVVTITTFLLLLLLEAWLGEAWFLGEFLKTSGEINNPFLAWLLDALQGYHVMVGSNQTDMIRAMLTVIIGTMSAATLFIGSYYGKMSLSDSIKDHERMIDLYELIKEKKGNGEPEEELIEQLAREFLIENSIWYAYQNQNKAEFVFF